MSAYLCILVYKLASRTFGERTGRLAAVMCVFMPILIQLTGTHVKEMELIFLSVFALERMDYLIRSKRYTFWNILFPVLLVGMTFGFRTVIGMCLIFAFLVFVILSPNNLVSRKGKIVSLSVTLAVFLVFLFTVIGSEMKIVYMLNFSGTDYLARKYESLGLKYSEISKSKYLFPVAFVLPLSPMVDVAPVHNKLIHGSTFVKNFMAFFAMLSLVIAVRQRKWRDFGLIWAFELSYLTIVVFTFTSNSERYHEPAIPLILVMAAYAMTHLRHKDMKLLYVYCGLLFVALFVWNWLKLAARGIV
jgi:4-amino-4-deoxy-L-arabinose transferase-like glycosyltransferase